MEQAASVDVANQPAGEGAGDGKKASIGVNLRVTGHCQQGGRKYMEDYFAVAYQQTDDEKDLEYAFFGIFDGHGGPEAAAFAKEHLMEYIVKDPAFWCDDDEHVLRAIKNGFIDTHHAIWKVHDKWPKTASGLPSTAGTTASIAFIRRGKIYVGHVGDSGITLGYQAPGSFDWQAKALTVDHKPECEDELARIEGAGGKVVSKMGVPRVVWNRPRIGHKGPVRRSTPIDEIPFLAVARSLGDLWSYNPKRGEFVVSPAPDVDVHVIDTSTFRCLIFGTDGLYNMLSPQMAVHVVQEAERRNEEATLFSTNPHWINPSKTLVERALDRWCSTKMRADNTSVITLMLDPPGPPRAQVLRTQRLEREKEILKKMGIGAAPTAVAPPAGDVPTDAGAFAIAQKELPPGTPPKVKLRESTAFDPYPSPRPADHAPANPSAALTPNLDPPLRVQPSAPTIAPPTLPVPESTSLPSEALPPPASASAQTSQSSPSPSVPNHSQKENSGDDIQSKEVTSTSDGGEEAERAAEAEDKAEKKKKCKKLPIVQRKFNLRSNNQDAQAPPVAEKGRKVKEKVQEPSKEKEKCGQMTGAVGRRSARAPLGENVAECSRLVGSESRVLRETRNTAPNTNANRGPAKEDKREGKSEGLQKAFKKKKIMGKMKISNEKKRLLQGILFKKDGQVPTASSAKPQPKTKENNAKTPPKPATTTPQARSAEHVHITRASVGRRSERQRAALESAQAEPREMRKSTLKLRMPDGLFKAKLRAPPKLKLKGKAKGLSLKKYVGS